MLVQVKCGSKFMDLGEGENPNQSSVTDIWFQLKSEDELFSQLSMRQRMRICGVCVWPVLSKQGAHLESCGEGWFFCSRQS